MGKEGIQQGAGGVGAFEPRRPAQAPRTCPGAPGIGEDRLLIPGGVSPVLEKGAWAGFSLLVQAPPWAWNTLSETSVSRVPKTNQETSFCNDITGCRLW